MVLQKQVISIPFDKGYNQIVDPAQQGLAGNSEIINYNFDKVGALNKRSGFVKYAETLSRPVGSAVMKTFRDLISDGSKLYAIAKKYFASPLTVEKIFHGFRLWQNNGFSPASSSQWNDIDWLEPCEVGISELGNSCANIISAPIGGFPNIQTACDVSIMSTTSPAYECTVSARGNSGGFSSSEMQGFFTIKEIQSDFVVCKDIKLVYTFEGVALDIVINPKVFCIGGKFFIWHIGYNPATSSACAVFHILNAPFFPYLTGYVFQNPGVGDYYLRTVGSASMFFDVLQSGLFMYVVFWTRIGLSNLIRTCRAGIDCVEVANRDTTTGGGNDVIDFISISEGKESTAGDSVIITWKEGITNDVCFSQIHTGTTMSVVIARTSVFVEDNMVCRAVAMPDLDTVAVENYLFFEVEHLAFDYLLNFAYWYEVVGYKSGGTGNLAPTFPNARIAARPFYKDRKIYLILKNEISSSTVATHWVAKNPRSYFLCSWESDDTTWTRRTIAIACPSMAGIITEGYSNSMGATPDRYKRCTVPNTTTGHPIKGSNTFSFGASRQTLFSTLQEIASGSTGFTGDTVDAPVLVSFDMGAANALSDASRFKVSSKTLDRTTHIASGGLVLDLNINGLEENGFLHGPGQIFWTQHFPAGGFLEDAQVYYYIAQYEYANSAGEIVRSEISLPLKVVPDLGGNLQSAGIVVMAPSFGYESKRSRIRVTLWRTQKNSTVFRKTVLTPVPYLAQTAMCYFVDTTDDVSISDNEILSYTQLGSGELEPHPYSATRIIEQFGNRLWSVSSEDPTLIQYSKEKAIGSGLEFSQGQEVRISSGGSVTSLCAMDDKLIVFKSGEIHLIVGNGPDALGMGGTFQNQKVSSHVGCRNKNSIALIPDGIIFQSDKGFYLLGRGLQVSYIGAPVVDFNSYLVSDSVVLQEKSKVWFLLMSITTTQKTFLVYDYVLGQWSTHYSDMRPSQAVNLLGDPVLLDLGGDNVSISDPADYSDNGATAGNFGSFSTGWLEFDQVQGFQRIYLLHLLGKIKSDCTFTVSIYYNWETTAYETHTIDSAKLTISTDGTFRLPIRPARPQGCSSIKIKITETVLDTSSYEGLSLSNMSITVGVRGKMQRVRHEQ